MNFLTGPHRPRLPDIIRPVPLRQAADEPEVETRRSPEEQARQDRAKRAQFSANLAAGVVHWAAIGLAGILLFNWAADKMPAGKIPVSVSTVLMVALCGFVAGLIVGTLRR